MHQKKRVNEKQEFYAEDEFSNESKKEKTVSLKHSKQKRAQLNQKMPRKIYMVRQISIDDLNSHTFNSISHIDMNARTP